METHIPPKEVESLLSKLCVELGFCLPLNDVTRLKAHPPRTVDTFVAAVYAAEELNLVMSPYELQKAVRQRVAEVFERHKFVM